MLKEEKTSAIILVSLILPLSILIYRVIMKKFIIFLTLILVFSFILTSVVFANYPVKPVKIIVPWDAGSGTDIAARAIAEVAKKYFPQPFVIINKPGAGGQIGFEELSLSKDDGYTVGWINTPHIMSHFISGKTKYNMTDFQPICNIVTDPGVLIIGADETRFSDLQSLIKYAKEHPNELSAATTGPGGDDSIALSQLNEQADISVKDVPFTGSATQKSAILGRHVDFMMGNVSQVWSLHKEGKLKMVAVMTPERLPYIPDIPMFKELGYEVYSDSSRGIAIPAGVSPDITKILEDAFNKAFHDSEFQAIAEKSLLLLNYMDSTNFQKYLNNMTNFVKGIYDKNPW